MKLVRRIALCAAVLAAPLAAGLAPAAGRAFPEKPVTLLIPFAPGGSSELVARVLAQKLPGRWNQQLVVDHRPGGAGNVAMEAAARARPDGHTLIVGHIGTLAVNPVLFRSLPYDAARDFAPVSLVATVPNVIVVHPGVPARTLRELVALSKSRPGTLHYGSAGNGSGSHLAMEYLRSATGLDLVHVPYKGTGPMMTDLLSGQTQATLAGVPPLLGHLRQGRLRALAVGGAERIAALPEVPTVAELGYPGFETSQWYGLLAPARTPPAVVRQIADDVRAVLREPDARERLASESSTPLGSTPAEFASFIERERERWGKVVRAAGIRVD